MRWLVPLLLVTGLIVSAPVGSATGAPQVTQASVKPKFTSAAAFDVSPAMRDVARQAATRSATGSLDRPERGPAAAGLGFAGDAAVQNTTRQRAAAVDIPSPSVSFEGIPATANIPILGGIPIPPDPVGDVGPNHYVQMVNTAWAVFSKTGTGTIAFAGPRLSGKTDGMRSHRPRPARAARSAFAGFRFPPDVIVLAVRWYLRFGLSYRDVEELLAERGIEVDHVTVYRWVLRFTGLLAEAARPCRHAVGDRWQVDETYVKVAGQWRYVDRAIDQFGQVVDVFVSRQRDGRAARRFFEQTIGTTKITPAETVTTRR